MAVLPEMPGLSVTIETDAGVCTEFDTQSWDLFSHEGNSDPDLPATRCYIESCTGQSYSICYTKCPTFRLAERDDVLVVSAFVDGIPIGKEAIRDTQGGEISFRVREGEDGLVHHDALVFSEITPVEGANRATVDTDRERVKTIGTIKVVVGTAKLIQMQDKPKVSEMMYATHSMELAQKALILHDHELSHGTCFEPISDSGQPDDRFFIRVKDEHDLGVFYFHYLSHDSRLKRCRSPPVTQPAATDSSGATSGADDSEVGPRTTFKETIRVDGRIEIDLTEF